MTPTTMWHQLKNARAKNSYTSRSSYLCMGGTGGRGGGGGMYPFKAGPPSPHPLHTCRVCPERINAFIPFTSTPCTYALNACACCTYAVNAFTHLTRAHCLRANRSAGGNEWPTGPCDINRDPSVGRAHLHLSSLSFSLHFMQPIQVSPPPPTR